MNLWRALRMRRRKARRSAHADLRDKLPLVHSFVEVAVKGRVGRSSVCVDELTRTELTVRRIDGLAPGDEADFVYSTGRGKYRFHTSCTNVNDVAVTFALPATIKTIESYAERRSSARVPWIIPVQWRYAPGGEGYGEFLSASMMDLSRGGASLVVGRELKPGAQVEVRFTVKSRSEPLVEIGQVVRAARIETSNRNAAGIRFLEVGRENERILTEFVSERQALRRERGVV
jgi:hypothetical protein